MKRRMFLKIGTGTIVTSALADLGVMSWKEGANCQSSPGNESIDGSKVVWRSSEPVNEDGDVSFEEGLQELKRRIH